jgi:hypothetical protein
MMGRPAFFTGGKLRQPPAPGKLCEKVHQNFKIGKPFAKVGSMFMILSALPIHFSPVAAVKFAQNREKLAAAAFCPAGLPANGLII